MIKRPICPNVTIEIPILGIPFDIESDAPFHIVDLVTFVNDFGSCHAHVPFSRWPIGHQSQS